MSVADIVEHIVEEDVERLLDTSNLDVRNVFAQQRRQYYEKMLLIGANVSILSENISGKWEHSFSIPCYQAKVEEIVRSYQAEQ